MRDSSNWAIASASARVATLKISSSRNSPGPASTAIAPTDGGASTGCPPRVAGLRCGRLPPRLRGTRSGDDDQSSRLRSCSDTPGDKDAGPPVLPGISPTCAPGLRRPPGSRLSARTAGLPLSADAAATGEGNAPDAGRSQAVS
eukprot:13208438-Alexandrium_andersonii.AAC.2